MTNEETDYVLNFRIESGLKPEYYIVVVIPEDVQINGEELLEGGDCANDDFDCSFASCADDRRRLDGQGTVG